MEGQTIEALCTIALSQRKIFIKSIGKKILNMPSNRMYIKINNIKLEENRDQSLYNVLIMTHQLFEALRERKLKHASRINLK
jgi:hypothetical protein